MEGCLIQRWAELSWDCVRSQSWNENSIFLHESSQMFCKVGQRWFTSCTKSTDEGPTGELDCWWLWKPESVSYFHIPCVCMFIFIQLHWVHEPEMTREQYFGDIGDDHSFPVNISDYTKNSKSGWVRSISCSQDTICCCMITLKWLQRTTTRYHHSPEAFSDLIWAAKTHKTNCSEEA